MYIDLKKVEETTGPTRCGWHENLEACTHTWRGFTSNIIAQAHQQSQCWVLVSLSLNPSIVASDQSRTTLGVLREPTMGWAEAQARSWPEPEAGTQMGEARSMASGAG